MFQNPEDQNKSGLISILKDVSDLAILKNEGWYRVPIKSAPGRWPPKWLAFYHPKVFGEDAYQIRYYGFVKEIKKVKRNQLFPNEIQSTKSEQEYYQVFLEELVERPTPIISARPRRLVFVPTTWYKFENAVIVNDLFDDSPLEDRLWLELKERKIDAERQWRVKVSNMTYYLDFAIFCKKGQIDVETDGDTYHLERSRVAKDNLRDNSLQIDKWLVLRFNTSQLTKQFKNNCLGIIQNGINSLGGLENDSIVSQFLYSSGNYNSQQLSLFESALNQYRAECIEESDDYFYD